MAKIDHDKIQAKLFQRTERYAANVRVIYEKYLSMILSLVKDTELEDGKPFSFSEYGYSDQVTQILRSMYSQLYQEYKNDITFEWEQANRDNDNLVQSVFGKGSMEDNHYARYFVRNKEALDTFFARKTEGMNLSQRVWQYTGMFKQELQDTLDLALSEGTPANSLASKIKKYLQEPDRFYRRFRVKIGENEDGSPKYGRIWKRRTFDKETGLYQWVNEDPRKYHPGRGVYRSSYRNAQRLARTETNIAYRSTDFDRWHGFDFVVAVEIKLSNNHPILDICDDLAGIYPKDFKWTGWHPNCRCYMVPVLAAEYEIQGRIKSILDGSDEPIRESDNEVTEMPEAFKLWMSDNQERAIAAHKRNTLPYFLRDNFVLRSGSFVFTGAHGKRSAA